MKADTVTKAFISSPDVFADVFNYYIYKGQQVICSEQLVERDSTELALPYGADGASVPVQKFRDVQKLYTAMTDGKLEYILYGAENQSEIHYAMAVKNNLYDALDYAGQVEEAASSHRKAMKLAKQQPHMVPEEKKKKPNSGEFLGGFWKEDRLIPSITVTIYFGVDEWDGPLSLFDMMDITDPRVLACMNDYRVNLIAPAQMEDEEIMKFQSNLREVMLFIKYSKDKENLNRVLKSNEKRFRELERRAADVIEVITNMGLKYKKREEKIDMCQAIQEMRIEERQIGELQKSQKVANTLYKLGTDIEKIAQIVDYDVKIVKEWLGLPNGSSNVL